ncbi:MAG TPA: 6-phosphogluconolactonase, partial [Flavitalea sp.]|nr:6-phosphogluconolactonase [Flavitalea sp.]
MNKKSMNVKTQVIVFGSESKLLEQTVNTMATIAKDAIATRGKFSLVLSGGRTPDALYKFLSMPKQIPRLPWDRTDVFWGDERY